MSNTDRIIKHFHTRDGDDTNSQGIQVAAGLGCSRLISLSTFDRDSRDS
jgi:hypothetical protein